MAPIKRLLIKLQLTQMKKEICKLFRTLLIKMLNGGGRILLGKSKFWINSILKGGFMEIKSIIVVINFQNQIANLGGEFGWERPFFMMSIFSEI